MFQKSDDQLGRRFLKEALPLISTYFSGESVELAGVATSLGQDSDSESQDFGNHIRFRHAIACCTVLFPIVQRIEGGLSSITDANRTETKGVIRGRLDIPRYVARKSSSLSWPKTYPILVTTESPVTPENELVVRVFRTLLQRLPVAQFPANSAEVALGRRYKSWILGRMRRAPWAAIPCRSSLPRLYMEACRRIARRQTGNELAYSSLVDFIRDWRLVDEELAGAASSESFIDSFLSFPADQSFLDRVYEIWCLRAVANSFIQLGGQLIDGPCKMTESRRKPVYLIELASSRIEIWFQSSLPSEGAVWLYDSTGSALRGIPDITVVANGKHRIIIDAKNRIVKGATRSEETYKMLGYFENFREALKAETNWGVLAFVSLNGFSRTLSSSNGRLLELISAHPANSAGCTFMNNIKPILKSWIDRVCATAS
ncbi:hypothetical protein ACEPUM_29380 [Pseudomonas aeruginosa]|uniref:hypothetical protein n=1 Tax=Pseudomonas aeruginosa TaxID=287 RepID=UPI001A2D8AFE|nr:hypothetical protein [Pseudomonas aeruginosa]HBO3624173.1 hypothetical protein [Pseudomonas aeruginosa]HCF5589030.1 hypothetical protein [Pseudomonas aeruginosa]